MAPDQKTSSAQFRAEHAEGKFLVLPNAWDAASARIVESCGALAIATTSAAISWAHGVPDGEHLSSEALLGTVREIVRAVRLPVSVDFEAGYASTGPAIADGLAALIDAGAVGINLEDGSSLPGLLASKIEVARTVAARTGVDLFVNARTDVYLHQLVPAERRVEETLSRAKLYRNAGCDGLFVPAVVQSSDIQVIARECDLPLNVLARPTLPPADELRRLGVRRLSVGGALALAAHGRVRRLAKQLLETGAFAEMYEEAFTHPEMNELSNLRPR